MFEPTSLSILAVFQVPFAWFAGGWEWVIVLAVVLLLFGNRIPKVARSLGSGIVEFRKGLKGESEEPNELPGKKQDSLPGDSGSADTSSRASTQERQTH